MTQFFGLVGKSGKAPILYGPFDSAETALEACQPPRGHFTAIFEGEIPHAEEKTPQNPSTDQIGAVPSNQETEKETREAPPGPDSLPSPLKG